jgi:hypothetical protein
MPLSRIGRLVMDLSHSTSCTHKFSKKHTPSGHHQPLAWFLFQEDEARFKLLATARRPGNSDPRPAMPMHAIQGQYVGHHRYIYQHVIILSAIRLFKEPSFSIQHTDVDASHTCSICFAQYVQRMLDHMLWNSRFKKNLWHGYRLLCVIWTYLPWQWWIQRLPCESFQLGAAFLMSRSRSQDDNGSVFQKGKKLL